MKYLVSMEKTDYHLWQIELLIESFKIQSLDEHLIIAVADNEKGIKYFNPKNLNKHKDKFLHKNLGKRQNYLKFNKWYAANIAANKITNEFVLLEPDMILVEPIPLENGITFQKGCLNKDYFLNNHIDIDAIIQTKFNDFPCIGNIIQFNKIPINFFERIIFWINRLINYQYAFSWNTNDPLKINQHTDIAALIITFSEFPELIYKETTYYESTLHDNINTNFIHYQRGFSPYFSKNLSLNEDNPFNTLLNCASTINTNILQNITRTYLEN